MSFQEFVRFLIADMEATAAPAVPTAFAQSLLDQAKVNILSGSGDIGFFTQSNINGKSFTRIPTLSAVEVARACREAIDLFNGTQGSSSFTFLDFSRMNSGAYCPLYNTPGWPC